MRNQLINLIERIFAHPKTTIAGLVLIALVSLYLFKKIDVQQMGVAIGILTGGGLMVSKDPNPQQ